MPAADSRSSTRHSAAHTPLGAGMDCKPKKHANKKLVQARLPFKRLNPEPKDYKEPKRPRAPPCLETGVSDGENETEPCPVRNGPALVNGRGPLDGFLNRGRPTPPVEISYIDLTKEDSVSPLKLTSKPTAPSPRVPARDEHHRKDKRASTGKLVSSDHTSKTAVSACRVFTEAENAAEENKIEADASVLQLDTTQDSDSEEEEEDDEVGEDDEEEESMKADVSSLGNVSMLSPSSASSSSAAESSPESARTDGTATAAEPKTTPKRPAEDKTLKRRSLKGEQEKRLLQRQEKERRKEESRAAKEKKKEEARRMKEEREKEKRDKKEKEEREKRERKEKEEKEKAERLKAKEEQRKSKQEAKLEEKRKKEEEKKLKEEEKRMKEAKDRLKAEKAEITRFLQKPKTQLAPKTLSAACGKFAPFEIKEHMCLAPLTRVQCDESILEELDQYLLKPGSDLDGLKDWIRKPRSSGPTKPRVREPLRDCVTVVEGPKPDGVPDRKRYGSMKLLQFRENHRPAYWGTWSKKSSQVSPRCPLRQDKALLDYEVDSDDEWEEEEPGESLSHSEGEEEEGGEEGGDNDDDDDGFFVPHGYLSDGEGALEEEEGGDLEKQKVRQKLKAREWDELMSSKKKVKVLEAVVRGCVWVEDQHSTLELFHPYAVCLLEPLPKPDTSPSPEDLSRKRQADEQLLGKLLPLLHGNVNSSKVIITEFQEFCRQQSAAPSSPPGLSSPAGPAEHIPTRIRLKRIIKSNAIYEKRLSHRPCWYVHAEVLARLGQEQLPVPCQWAYLTSGAREEPRDEPQGSSPTTPQSSSPHTPTASNKRKSAGSMSITRFMKKCADPEQTEAMETDGFQADTEDDEEEDCVIVSAQSCLSGQKEVEASEDGGQHI